MRFVILHMLGSFGIDPTSDASLMSQKVRMQATWKAALGLIHVHSYHTLS